MHAFSHPTRRVLATRALPALLVSLIVGLAMACSDKAPQATSAAETRGEPAGHAEAKPEDGHEDGHEPKHEDEHGHGHGANDWCAGHGLPESKCTKCNPELIPQFKAAGDWCAEHGYPESACPICNPQQPPGAQAAASHGEDEHGHAVPEDGHEDGHGHGANDWCAGHGLPESKCTKCNPELIPQFKAAGDWCAEHGYPESACPICNPQQPPSGAGASSAIAPGTRIRFRSPDLEQSSGIGTAPAQQADLDIGVASTARIDFDRNRLADVRAPVGGIVREVLVDLGQEVEAGARLFLLESPRVGDLQGQLGAARQRVEVARANFQRQEDLRQQQIASARQMELAQQELEAAEAALRSLSASLRMTGAAGGQAGRFAVRAPIAGTVVRRPATVGTFATQETSLATIADITTMWALLDVRDADAAAVRLGQPVTLRVDGLPEKTFTGKVTWIAAEVDPRTRTVATRAEVKNPDGLLRAHQFARANIQVAAPAGAVAVPRAAVQRVGEEMAVFVRTGQGLYEPRVVALGRTSDDLVQVSGAIHAGEPVVTVGAFLLKTELSKDSIGAGCCEVEPPGGK